MVFVARWRGKAGGSWAEKGRVLGGGLDESIEMKVEKVGREGLDEEIERKERLSEAGQVCVFLVSLGERVDCYRGKVGYLVANAIKTSDLGRRVSFFFFVLT